MVTWEKMMKLVSRPTDSFANFKTGLGTYFGDHVLFRLFVPRLSETEILPGLLASRLKRRTQVSPPKTFPFRFTTM